MRIVLMAAGLLGVCDGCTGPLTKPMVDRLNEETQQQVDEAWLNMLTPPDRLDRTLLLDVILSMELHQLGVDHLQMVSQKRVGDGLVLMEVRYDRANPTFDEFSISFIDARGDEVRRERFTREEVTQRFEFLFDAAKPTCSTEPADQDDVALQAEWKRRQAQREVRIEEIRAATQPCEAR